MTTKLNVRTYVAPCCAAFELTPRVDRGGRRVLELGAGIGLLSIMAALGGAAEA